MIIIVDGIGHIDLGYPKSGHLFYDFLQGGGGMAPLPLWILNWRKESIDNGSLYRDLWIDRLRDIPENITFPYSVSDGW